MKFNKLPGICLFRGMIPLLTLCITGIIFILFNHSAIYPNVNIYTNIHLRDSYNNMSLKNEGTSHQHGKNEGNSHQHEKKSSANSTLPTTRSRNVMACSNQILQELYKKQGHFPSRGALRNYYFQPESCRMLTRDLKSGDICLPDKKIKHIVTLGDSNGKRYFEGLLKHVQLGYSKCEMTRKETKIQLGFMPDKVYLSHDNLELQKAMTVKRRRCRECAGRRYVCTPRDGSKHNQLILEHIGMPLLHDDTLTVNNKHPKYSKTFQEYIFRHYLNDRVPDMVILFMPVNHMKHSGSLESRKMSIDHVGYLARKYLKTTAVYWIPGTEEIEKMKPKRWKNKIYEGLNVSQRIKVLNQRLFSNIKQSLLDDNSRHFAFFDMQTWSSRAAPLSTDGIHWERLWYDRVMNAFLQVFCNS